MGEKIYYSYSRINTFKICPRQYKFKYIDELEETQIIEAFMGSRVHETLEYLYTTLLQNSKRIPTLKELLLVYKKHWDSLWDNAIRIVRKEKSKTYYYRLGQHCLKYYYTMHHPFSDRTIGIEKEIRFKIGNHYIKGFIDRLAETKSGEINIIDYKTGKWILTRKEKKENLQLGLYQLKIQKEYPNKKINLIWYYLQKQKTIKVHKTIDDLKKVKNRIVQYIQKIEAEKNWYPKKSFICDWCSFRNVCPAMKKTVGIQFGSI